MMDNGLFRCIFTIILSFIKFIMNYLYYHIIHIISSFICTKDVNDNKYNKFIVIVVVEFI